jgi:hypothetical protein
VGIAAGCLLIGLLILLPRWLQGDFYEVEDALLAMGIPLVALGAAVGYLIGARRRLEEQPAGHPSSAPRLAAVVRLTVAGAVCVLAVWLFLWGVGAVGVAPLGVG